MRYITIKFFEHYKIFGLERCNFDKLVYVTEGQIDSLFIPNCLAMGGSISGLDKLLEYAPNNNFRIVPDIEPRNKETVDFIEKSLKKGFKVCLWPLKLKTYGKDMNDLILNSGKSRKEIFDIINSNMVEGNTGLIKLKFWRM